MRLCRGTVDIVCAFNISKLDIVANLFTLDIVLDVDCALFYWLPRN